MSNILVIAEHNNKKLRKATLAAITFARQLAETTGGEVLIGVFGHDVAQVAGDAAAYGAKAVLVVDDPALTPYTASTWARAVADLAVHANATCVAATSTTFARDLLPRVAARMSAGMVSEVVAMTGTGSDVRFKRPMWAGNVLATVAIKTSNAVFCVRGTDFLPAEQVPGESPIQFVAMTLQPDARIRFVSFEPTVSERPELTEAKVVIAGGRGLRDKDGFAILNPLADLLGAALGGTRAAVDSGLLANDLQIGQTGKVVAPNLYIAVALSGAIQHLAGMKNSKVIVAINKDEEAPIFSVADYGLVADAFKAVPELVAEITKAKGA